MQMKSLNASAKLQRYVIYEGVAQVAKAAKTSVLELHFRVRDGFHVQSHTPKSELQIPTVFELQPADGVRAAEVVYPAEKLDVYTGSFTVKVPVVAAAGEHTLDGVLRYQACDSTVCYPPETLPVQVSFTAK
jgi:thiol:disulfide interchange protein